MSAVLSREQLKLPSKFVPPADGSAEAAIARAFAQALKVDLVGADDCFFDLGGDSLLAAEISALAGRELGVDFPLSLLATASTPRELASALGRAAAARVKPLAGSAPIFSVHGMQGFMLMPRDFIENLGPGRKFHMFELPGLRDGRPRLRSVPDIAAAYREELTRIQPTGQVNLSGFCVGMLVTIELAKQLLQQGRQVARMVLVDPNLPASLVAMSDAGHWDHPQARALYMAETRRREAEAEQRATIKEAQANGSDFFQQRHQEHRFSMDARSKLAAAFVTFVPPKVELPTTIIVSHDRVDALRLAAPAERFWDRIVPDRVLRITDASHREILTTQRCHTARLIRAAFDGQPA